MQVDNIGKRLREERERLGLSQEAFGALGGVKKLTQLKYEKGERTPTLAYLEGLRAHDVDVDYILFGLPNPEAPVECPFRQSQGWSEEPFTLKDCRAWASGRRWASGGPTTSAYREACRECSKNPIKHGPPVESTAPDVDGRLLERVIEALETVLARTGVGLAPAKKARTIAMLYRASRASGKVDPKMVEDAVAVAS
jgi:transcriptional regulator with XRE-family HTH domain